ncbi:MAG: lysophospholipid acyltransferase family protein [Rhodanobacteraceae bacterium]
MNTRTESVATPRDPLRALRYLWRVPILVVLVVIGSLLAIFLLPSGHAVDSIGNRLIRRWQKIFLRLFGVRVRGVGTPLPNPVMFVSNHGSWMDISVLHTQRVAGFVAKAEIARWPLVGWLAARAGTIFHQRGSTQSMGTVMERMTDRLKAGLSVAAFPEGGTAPAGTLKVFHARILQTALDANAPLQPVALRYLRGGRPWFDVAFRPGESFVGNLWRLLGERRIDAEVLFLEPVAASAQGRRRMADTARARIADALGIAA